MGHFDRQSFLGPQSEAVLTETIIGLVGLGGGGSHVAQQLAHVGVGTLIVIDPDVIEGSNLNRLVGGRALDVLLRKAKVKIAARLIRGVRPTTKVVQIRKAWQAASESLKQCHVIIGGVDSVRAKDELDAFCRRFMISYIDMGMDVFGPAGQHLIAGQVVLSSPGTPCLRCLQIVTDKALAREGEKYGAAGGEPQVVWPNGLLASAAVGLAIQLVSPWHQHPIDSAYLEYDGNSGTLTSSARLKLAQGRECPHYPTNERGDPGFDIRNPGRDERPQIKWFRSLRNWLSAFVLFSK